MLEIHPCVKLNLISLWDGPRSTIGSRWNVNLTVDPNIELNGRINVRFRCSLSLIFHVCVCASTAARIEKRDEWKLENLLLSSKCFKASR